MNLGIDMRMGLAAEKDESARPPSATSAAVGAPVFARSAVEESHFPTSHARAGAPGAGPAAWVEIPLRRPVRRLPGVTVDYKDLAWLVIPARPIGFWVENSVAQNRMAVGTRLVARLNFGITS